MSGDVLLDADFNAFYGDVPALRDIRFQLAPGEILGLVGTSGAGKSTLVHSLLGLLPWRGGKVTGNVTFSGRNLPTLRESELRQIRGRRIALVPQIPLAALNPALSLERQLHEAWRAHDRRRGAAFTGRVTRLLDEVHLPSDRRFLSRRPAEISVGQAQRVLIAMALLHHPEILIADEPTSALDPVTQHQVVDLLRELNRRHGTALLYISHDLISVIQLCDRVAVLDRGALVETVPTERLEHARHPATRALIEALPVPVPLLRRRLEITEAAEVIAT